MSQFDTFSTPPQKQGMSSRTKVILGCGITAVIVVILVCGGGGGFLYFYYKNIQKEAGAFALVYEQQGYVRVANQSMLDIRNDITVPTVFIAPMVNIYSNSQADIAIASIGATVINGTIEGNVDFHGMVLDIQPGAVIKGDLRVDSAKVVNVNGIVEGSISGNITELQDPTGQAAPNNKTTEPTEKPDENAGENNTGDGG